MFVFKQMMEWRSDCSAKATLPLAYLFYVNRDIVEKGLAMLLVNLLVHYKLVGTL
jgi:hypothetical protein